MMYERVQIAADMLIQMLNGNTVPEKVFVPCPIIIRRSCGCNFLTNRKIQSANPISAPTEATDTSRIFKEYRDQIKQKLGEIFNPSVTSSLAENWDEQLIDSLLNELAGDSPGCFVVTFDKIFAQMETESQNFAKLYQILSAFQPSPEWKFDHIQSQMIANILDQVKTYLLEMEIKVESIRRRQDGTVLLEKTNRHRLFPHRHQ